MTRAPTLTEIGLEMVLADATARLRDLVAVINDVGGYPRCEAKRGGELDAAYDAAVAFLAIVDGAEPPDITPDQLELLPDERTNP